MGNDAIIHSSSDPDKDGRSEGQYPIIIYRSEDSDIEIRLPADPSQRTIWATQRQIGDLLNLSVPTVNEHISNFKEQRGKAANRSIRKFRILADDGKMRSVEHYDMTAVIYVGFRAQATARVIAFQEWVGQQIDTLLAQQKPQTPLEVLQEVVQQMVVQERNTLELRHRQDNLEQDHHALKRDHDDTKDRLSRVEAHTRAAIDGGSQLMSIIDYCYWRNLDSSLIGPKHLPALVDRAKQLSHDQGYGVGKISNPRGGYDSTFHINVLNEMFAGYR